MDWRGGRDGGDGSTQVYTPIDAHLFCVRFVLGTRALRGELLHDFVNTFLPSPFCNPPFVTFGARYKAPFVTFGARYKAGNTHTIGKLPNWPRFIGSGMSES